MKLYLKALFTLSIIFSPISSMASGALYKDLGDWSVYVDESIGGCFTVARYDGGTIFRVGIDPSGDVMGVYVIVGNDKWKSLEQGKRYDFSIQFGKKSKWNGLAAGFKFDQNDRETYLLQNIATEDQVEFFQEFMEQSSMRLFYEDKEIEHLTLRGTYVAGTTVVECQKLFNSQPRGGNSDPFSNGGSRDNSDPFS